MGFITRLEISEKTWQKDLAIFLLLRPTKEGELWIWVYLFRENQEAPLQMNFRWCQVRYQLEKFLLKIFQSSH